MSGSKQNSKKNKPDITEIVGMAIVLLELVGFYCLMLWLGGMWR